MAINVTALNNYVEEKRLPLIAKSFLRGKTIDLIQIETGVLQDTALNLVSASVTFGDGASCGWDATEGVALSQRLLKPTFLKVNQVFCDKDLLKKWASYEVKLADLEAKLAEIATTPAAQPVIDEFENIRKVGKTGDKNLDKRLAIAAALKN